MSSKLKDVKERITAAPGKTCIGVRKGNHNHREGRNDIAALRKLTIKGDIIAAKASGRSLLDVLREVRKRGTKEVILLMDFDRRRKEWTKRLTQNLERMRVKPNLFFWNALLSIVGHDLKDIEGLPTYMETLSKKCGDQSSKV